MAAGTPNNQIRRKGSFAPLYSQYYLDDAIAEAGEAAELLFVRGLAFQAGTLNDGLITDNQLVRGPGVGMADAKDRAESLVRVGLWDRLDNGYNVLAWLKWNKSRAEIEAAMEVDRQRKTRRPPSRPTPPPAPTESDPPSVPDSVADPAPPPPDSGRNPGGIPADVGRNPAAVQTDSAVQYTYTYKTDAIQDRAGPASPAPAPAPARTRPPAPAREAAPAAALSDPDLPHVDDHADGGVVIDMPALFPPGVADPWPDPDPSGPPPDDRYDRHGVGRSGGKHGPTTRVGAERWNAQCRDGDGMAVVNAWAATSPGTPSRVRNRLAVEATSLLREGWARDDVLSALGYWSGKPVGPNMFQQVADEWRRTRNREPERKPTRVAIGMSSGDRALAAYRAQQTTTTAPPHARRA